MRNAPVLALSAAILTAGAASAAPDAGPAHLSIKAHITGDKTVSSKVVIVMPPQEVGHEVVFALGDRFHLDKVDGGPGAEVHYGVLDRPLHHLTKITFDYKGAPSTPVTFTFFYDGPLAESADDAERLEPGVMELGLENAWFPFDPALQREFTSDADITGIPADRVVVAQGVVKHVGDRLILHRATTDFDMPFVAATGLHRATSPDFEIYARHLNGRVETIFRTTARPAFDYFTKLYGPFTAPSPIRVAVVPRSGGGYERRSFISTGDGAAEVKAHPDFPEYGPARHIAHEIAHAWWWKALGQSDDYWMVESMAEFSALRYVREAYGEGAFKTLLDAKRKAAETAGPILTGDKKKPNSAVLYQKGPVLLFDLEARVGRPTMDRFLGVIGRNPPQTTVEFLKALSDVAGPDVARDFEARLRS
jgi:hypothetical protein